MARVKKGYDYPCGRTEDGTIVNPDRFERDEEDERHARALYPTCDQCGERVFAGEECEGCSEVDTERFLEVVGWV
jgi:hypothetical protein